MKTVLVYKVVRLKVDLSTVSKGEIGIIMKSCAPELPSAFKVQWIMRSFSSVPVFEEQLEFVGEVSFPVVHVERQRDGSLTRVEGDESRRVVREDGMSADERYVKNALSDAARGFARLAVQHPAEGREFTDAIHRCQSILAVRACRRAFPAGWPDKGSGS